MTTTDEQPVAEEETFRRSIDAAEGANYDTARLVFADWLDEQGRADEAEAWRLLAKYRRRPESVQATAQSPITWSWYTHDPSWHTRAWGNGLPRAWSLVIGDGHVQNTRRAAENVAVWAWCKMSGRQRAAAAEQLAGFGL